MRVAVVPWTLPLTLAALLASLPRCVVAQSWGQDLAPLIGQTVRLEGLVDEAGTPFSVQTSAAEGPLVLVPLYAGCPHTCSPLAANVLRVVGEAGERLGSYRLASISIDPHEEAASLAAFRARLGLPPNWRLLRAANPERLRAALQELRFTSVVRDNGQIDHPNVAYVLSPAGAVVAVLPGLSLQADDLISAVAQARAGGFPWWRRYVFAIAVLGFAASAWVFFVVWTRRSRPTAAAPGWPATAARG